MGENSSRPREHASFECHAQRHAQLAYVVYDKVAGAIHQFEKLGSSGPRVIVAQLDKFTTKKGSIEKSTKMIIAPIPGWVLQFAILFERHI